MLMPVLLFLFFPALSLSFPSNNTYKFSKQQATGPAELEIICVRNCAQPVDPDEESPFLKVTCHKNCEGLNSRKLRWFYNGREPAIQLKPENGNEWIFKTMRPDDLNDKSISPGSYEWEVKSSLDNDGSTKHTISYKDRRVKVEFTCNQNCGYDAARDIVFITKCTYRAQTITQQCNVQMDYTIRPPGKYLLSGLYKEIITIPAGSYPPESKVNISGSPTRGRGDGFIRFLIQQPKHLRDLDLNYECLMSPESGVSGKTEFTFTCNYPEGYSFMVCNSDSNLGTFWTNNFTVWLSKGNPSPVKLFVILRTYIMKTWNFSPIVSEIETDDDNLKGKIEDRIFSHKEKNSFFNLIENKDYNRALQLALLLVESLKEDEHDHLRVHILSTIHKISDHLDFSELSSLLLKDIHKKPIKEAGLFYLVANILRDSTTRPQHGDVQSFELDSDIQENVRNVIDIASSLLVKDDAVLKKMNPTLQSGDYNLYDEFEPTKAEISWLYGLGTASLIDAIQTMTPFAFKKPLKNITFPNIKYEADAMQIYKPNQANAKIRIPNSSSYVSLDLHLLEELLSFPAHPLLYGVAKFELNPFWWHEIDKSIVSEVVMFNVYSQERHQQALKNPIDIYIETNNNMVLGRTEGIFNDYAVRYTISVVPGAMLTMKFHGVRSTYYALVTPHYPTSEEIKARGMAIDADTILNYRFQTGSYSVICVSLLGKIGQTYLFESGYYKCISYNMTSFQWSRDCQTVNDSLANMTHCHCEHTSLFAVEFFVPPNKIILPSDPVHIVLKENPVLPLTLSIATLIYLGLMAIAYRKDKELERIRKTIPLDDNVPGDPHKYVVIIHTGLGWNSGTTADVVIELIGTESTSRRHVLKTCKRSLLQRGYEDWVVIFTPNPLGEISYVRLFHNSRGSNPHWYCEMIVVKDIAAKNDYIFIVRKWFSVIYRDGRINRAIPVTDSMELKKARKKLHVKVVEKLKNEHLWLSVFSRSAHSGFSCKERVTAAYSVLLVSMLTSAMFFGLPGVTDDGSFFVSLRELGIIIESLLISVPVSVGLVLLFKKSRPKWTYSKSIRL